MKYKVLSADVEGLNTRVLIRGKADDIKIGEDVRDEFNVHYHVLEVSEGPDKYFNGMEDTTYILLEGMFSSRKIVTEDLDYFHLGSIFRR